jgi:hypothetical protein
LSNTREIRPLGCDAGVCNSARGRRTRAARASIAARGRARARCFREIARDRAASPRDPRAPRRARRARAPVDSSFPFASLHALTPRLLNDDIQDRGAHGVHRVSSWEDPRGHHGLGAVHGHQALESRHTRLRVLQVRHASRGCRAPRAPPPPEMSNAPHVESLGRVVVRTDRECDNIATMDLIFRRRGFEASKRVFYSRRLSDSLEKTHRRFQSSRSRSRRAGFFFRPTGDRSKNVLSISRKGL